MRGRVVTPNEEESLKIARRHRSLRKLRAYAVGQGYPPYWAPNTWSLLRMTRKPKAQAQAAAADDQAPAADRLGHVYGESPTDEAALATPVTFFSAIAGGRNLALDCARMLINRQTRGMNIAILRNGWDGAFMIAMTGPAAAAAGDVDGSD